MAGKVRHGFAGYLIAFILLVFLASCFSLENRDTGTIIISAEARSDEIKSFRVVMQQGSDFVRSEAVPMKFSFASVDMDTGVWELAVEFLDGSGAVRRMLSRSVKLEKGELERIRLSI